MIPPSATPPPSPPAPPRDDGDPDNPDNLDTPDGWDSTPVRVADGCYDYDLLLKTDRRLRWLLALAFLPAVYVLFELGLGIFLEGRFLLLRDVLLTGAVGAVLLFAVQSHPVLQTTLAYSLFLVLQIIILPDTGTLGVQLSLGSLPVMVAAGVGWWLYHSFRRDFQRHRYPAEIHELVGRIPTFFELRRWVALQREADHAEQSVRWEDGNDHPQ